MDFEGNFPRVYASWTDLEVWNLEHILFVNCEVPWPVVDSDCISFVPHSEGLEDESAIW